MSSEFDSQFRSKYPILAGIDEVGRGPLAGPVVACACILPDPCPIEGINDSKALTPKKREAIYEVLAAHEEVHLSFAFIDAMRIDEINIRQATLEAMRQAALSLSVTPNLFLIDGRDQLDLSTPSQSIIKGDLKSQVIGAASIAAKVVRDRYMEEQDVLYPEYDFSKHKGYGTKVHRDAILEHGPSLIHRMSFLRKLLSV